MSFIGALFKKPKAPDNPLTLSLDPNAPRKLILGKTALAGSFAFHGLSNSSRDLTRVALLAGHRCNGVTRIWADGQLAFSGRLQHGVRTPLTDFRRFRGLGGFTNDLHVTWYDGRPDQTADSWLTTTSHSPLGWSSTDRLRGCSYAIITMRHDNDNINTVLEMVFEVEGAPLYDRRLDTTAGGSGAQRWDDPSTWVWTDNAAVATDHYQLGMIGGENNDKLLFGMGLKTWQVPYDEFEANADTCDEIVNGQTRYATNGVLSAADDHKDNIVRLAEAMAAVPYDTGGRVIIRPQQARPISLTLSDSDLVSGADYDLSESPGGDDLVNTVRGEYQEPSVRYKEQEYPSVEDTDLISKDGRAFEVTLNLPLETSYIRAQRIANIELEVQKRRDIIEETFMPIANVLEVGDWFQRGSNLRGPSSKNYEVIDKQVFADKTVRIKGRETDPAITAFGVNQARPVDLPAPIAPFLPIRPSVPPATGVGGTESGGGATVPDGLITINPGVDDEIDRFDYFEVEYGVATGSGASLNITDGTREAAVFPNDGGLGLHITGLLPDTDYAWRIRGVTGELPTEWSGYSQFTTGVDFVATNSASLGGVPSAQIINGLSEITDVVVPSLSSSIDTLNDQVADTNADLLSAVDQAAAARLTLSNEADAARDIIEGELDRLLTILPSESIRLPFDAEQTAWWRHREYAPEREPAVLPSYFSFEDDPVEGNQLIIDGAEQTVIARFPIPMNRAEPRVFRFSGEFKVDRVATDGSADSRLLAILYGLGADHRDAGLAGAAVTTIQVFSESPGSDGWTPFEWEVTSSGSADDRVDDFLGASSNYPGSSVHLLRFAFQLNYNNGDGSMRARNFLVEDITDALENQSRILSEEQTRIDEDNALASSINILSSRTDDRE